MTKREKRLQRLRQNPKTVSFEELQAVLDDFGFTLERSSGSHFRFRAESDGVTYQVTVPFRRPFLLAVYVKQVLAIFDQMTLITQQEEEDDAE